jgi:translocation and assembly module TamB
MSSAGTKFIAKNIQHFVPGLDIEETDGALLDGISTARLRWHNDTVAIEAQGVKIKNNVETHWPLTVQLHSLETDKLIIRLQDPPAGELVVDDNPALMPLTLLLDKSDIKTLEIWQAHATQPIVLKDLQVTGKLPVGKFQVENINGTVGQLTIPLTERSLSFRNLTVHNGQLIKNVFKTDQLLGQYYDTYGTVDIETKGEFGTTEPNTLNLALKAKANHAQWGNGTVQGVVSGFLRNYNAELTGDWQYADYPRYNYALKANGTFDNIAVQNLNLKGAAGNAQASGKLDWQQGLKWDNVHIIGQNLKPQFFVKDYPADVNLDFTSSGQWSEQNKLIKLNVAKLKGQVRDYTVDAKGKGQWNGKALVFEDLDALIGQNRLLAKGQAGNELKVDWQIDAPNLNQLYPKIKGKAKGSGTLQGLADASRLQVDMNNLIANVEGYDLTAKGRLNWLNQKLSAQDLVVQSGNNRLDVTGQVMEPFDVAFKVDAKNLAKAWKGLEGSLQGQGTFKGTLAKPEVQADIKGSRLRFKDYRLGAVDAKVSNVGGHYLVDGTASNFQMADLGITKIDAKLSQVGGERYNLDAELATIKSGSNLIETAKLKGNGSIEAHQLSAAISHSEGKLAFNADGGWRNNQWQGSIQDLSLRDTRAGNWQATQTIQLKASAQSFSSSQICLMNHERAELCAQPTWSKTAGVSVEGSLQRVPLVMAKPWLPKDLQLPGMINADYQLAQHGGKPIAQVQIRLPDSSITIKDAKGKTETLNYSNASANLQLNDRNLDIQAQLELRSYGQIKADGQITLSPQDGRHRLNIRITTDMPDVGWMAKFSPQIDQLKGQLNSDFTITGVLPRPAITGMLRFTNGSVYLPETGASLSNMQLTMQAVGSDRATINGSLRAGNGTLTATGSISLADLANWQAEVNLQGNNLKLMDTYEAQIWVSPNLAIAATPKNVSISGNVDIPEATITLNELPPTANKLSDDVVIVGRRAPVREVNPKQVVDESIAIQPNVSVTVGNKVKFSGFGVDAQLNGRLQILKTRQDIVAQGVLNIVNGVYKAYGQNLTIERGRLLFNGPMDNPGLDIRAVREVEEEATVGIELSGTLQKPESTLFSNPTLSQTDILSYLLTGRPLSALTGGESNLVLQAVTGLGVLGGDSLAQQIGNKLGLDSVGLNAKNGDYQQSELALGKRLGSKLYVKYIVGLFDSMQRLVLTYQINRHLKLEAQTGLYQSIDLIYKIDTDRGPLGR